MANPISSSVNFLNSTLRSPMKKLKSGNVNTSPSSRRKRGSDNGTSKVPSGTRVDLTNSDEVPAKQFRLASRRSFNLTSDKVTLITLEKLLQEYAPLSGEDYMKAENSAPTPIVTEADAKTLILRKLTKLKGVESEEKENIVKDSNEAILDDLEKLAKQHQRVIAANLSTLDPRSPAKSDQYVEISLNDSVVCSPSVCSPAAKKVVALRSRTERMLRQFAKVDQMIDARSLPPDMRFDRDLSIAAQLAFLCKKMLKLKSAIQEYTSDNALDTLVEIKGFIDHFNKAISEEGEFTSEIPTKLKELWQIENSYQDNSDQDYKRGILKVESKTLKKWKPRLIELDTNCFTLKVFNGEQEEEEPKYEISIDQISGLQAIDSQQSTPFSPKKGHFGFTLTIDNFPRKTLSFATKSKKEMIEWCLLFDEAHVNLTAVPLLGASYKENLLHTLHTKTY